MQEKNSQDLFGKDKSEEAQIEKLIRLGGKRDEIDPSIRERVRQQVFNVWQEQQTTAEAAPKKQVKKNQWHWAMAAGIFSFCIAIFFGSNNSHQEHQKIVATITQSQGNTYVDNELLTTDKNIYAGQKITTADANLELKWKDSGVLKFDQKTEVQFINKDEIELVSGGIYFDSNNKSNIRILTSQGEVSDIGTQFETRIQSDDFSISVREGNVKLNKSKNESILIQSGKSLNISKGITSITDIKTNNSPWLWADAMNGSVNFDNHTMADVLAWLAKRENWQLTFKTEADKQHAENDILHGQFKTTNSQELLEQLALISDMRYQIANNILMVSYP